MFATYLSAMHESISRRVALVLLGVALLVSIAFNAFVHVRKLGGGEMIVAIGTQPPMPAAFAVPIVLEAEFQGTDQLWLLLAIFAASPLLTATLDKGWLELTFSKGTARWRIFTGRVLAGLTMYLLLFAVAALPVALRLWWETGVGTWRACVAIAIETLGFSALLSVASLLTLPQRGVALPMIASVAVWLLSPFLANRRETFYRLFSWHVGHEVVDWAYRILPKSFELEASCVAFIQGGKVVSWWPFWSTAVFAICVFGLTLRQLSRKSF
ncbi:MAG TPA: hypothetical protein VMM16_01365 [Verrucomicrobiae bacterium]|nr:hypothetical protein [Verrucomicrobiae bacterium]